MQELASRMMTKVDKNGLSVSFNLEGMTRDEQMNFLMDLFDIGMLDPYPKEIAEQFHHKVRV